jgi:hypothetical protein
MNELAFLIRLFAVCIWVVILLRFRSVQPPPSRAGRFTGPLAMVLLTSCLLLGAVNPVIHWVAGEDLSSIYTVAAFLAGLLGLAWLMLSERKGGD